MEGMMIKGVTKDENVSAISVLGVHNVPGIAFKVFSLLSQRKINVDLILQSVGRDGTKDLSFTVPLTDRKAAVEILSEQLKLFGATGVEYDDDVAKVSVVGAGMQSNSNVASTMFEALYENNINIRMISTSEIKISVLIDRKDANKAVNAIHEAFVG